MSLSLFSNTGPFTSAVREESQWKTQIEPTPLPTALCLILVSSVIQPRNKGHPSVWPGAWKISPTSRKYTPPASRSQNAWLSMGPRRIWKSCPFLERWRSQEQWPALTPGQTHSHTQSHRLKRSCHDLAWGFTLNNQTLVFSPCIPAALLFNTGLPLYF